MNLFRENDIYGRELLQELLNQLGATNQIETEDISNPVDYYFTLKDKNIVAEIKVRDIKYENYDTHLMEVGKYNSLVKDKNDNNLDGAIYVCFFGDNICYWYTTNTIKNTARKQNMYCNKTTAVYSGKKDKECLMIPKNKGTKFIKVNGIWSKSEN